jgi:pyruvate dehydrogenase E2 component (dihydrolipoamide acetyltransferase)
MAEFVMPILGADMRAGTLVAWRKQPGDAVHRGDIIAEVETDKADIEVEVFLDGVVERLLVEPGTEVPVGTPLAVIRDTGASAAAPAATPPTPVAATLTITTAVAPPPAPRLAVSSRPAISPAARKLASERGVDLARVAGSGPGGRIQLRDVELAAATAPPTAAPPVRCSPVARQMAAELGIDLTSVRGTGPEGRITRHDIARLAEGRQTLPVVPAPPPPTPAPPPPSERSLRMRQAIAAAMARSNQEIPQFQLLTTIDMSRALQWLTEVNAERPVAVRLLHGVLLLKAVALALREVPELNALWAGDHVELKPEIHVGVAISLRGGGLVAPALHHVDRQSLDELMRNLDDLVRRARALSLRSSEMSDPTVTVTSLGERGVETVYGLVYPPQVAIVGFGKLVERPWVVEGQILARPLVNATLSADHRVADGHRGSLLLAAIDRLLQEPDRL